MAEANPVQPQLRDQQLTENFAKYLTSVLAQMKYRSKAANRSSIQATIFLYGKSGDGKSSTLNYLFDKNIIPVQRGNSVTRNVTEYRCAVKSCFRSENNLNVSFIDTPGFGDTEGEETDVKNLAKISQFIDEHPEIGDIESDIQDSLDWVYPNIVLIVISATDDRMCGIYSTFSKMLHALSKLKVVDRVLPNVVIAVTHAMHFSRDEYTKETEYIETICNVFTRAHLSIEVPVVFIENLDKKKEMEHEGDWRILPDGTRQPINMFHAMTHLMRRSGDEIGVEAVKLLFSSSGKYDIEPIRATVQNPDLHFCRLWEEIVNRKFFSKDDNTIYSFLKEKNESDELRIFPFVYNLQKIDLIDIPSLKNMDLLEIKHRLHPYQLTNVEKEWLVHLFQVSRIKIKLEFKSLGTGYSRRFKDKRKKILEIRSLERMKIGNYEIDVPEYCTTKVLRQVAIDIVYDMDAKWFLMKRLKLNFRISYLLFHVEISDIGKFALNDTFVKKLGRFLPEGADTLDCKLENDTFTNFVRDYALHCTTGLYFGGCVVGELYFDHQKNEETDKIFLDKKIMSLRKQLEAYFDCIKDGNNPNTKHFFRDEDTISKLTECSLTYSGGTKKYHVKSILEINVIKWNCWTNSIENNPICIERIANSTFIGDILSSSPDENIRSYAEKLNPIRTETQTGLTDLNFQNSFELNSPSHSFHEEVPVLTRVQATDRVKAMCTVI